MLKYLEGFEVSNANTQLARKNALVTGTITVGGGRRLGGAAASVVSGLFRTNAFAQQAKWTLGFALRLLQESGSNLHVAVRLAASGEQLRLESVPVTDEGDQVYRLALKKGVTTLATTPALWVGTWYYIELQATVSTTVGSYDLKVDGVSVASDAGPIDTANAAVDDADSFEFAISASGNSVSWDDIYVCDDQGGSFDDFLGPVAVLGSRPDGDGASSDWIPSTGSDHWVLVDDPAGSPSDNDFVRSETPGDTDLYTYSDGFLDLVPVASILAVHVEMVASLQGSGSRTLHAKYRDPDTTLADGDDFDVEDGTWRYFEQFWFENPAAAAPWFAADVTGGQFGVGLVS